MKIRPLEV